MIKLNTGSELIALPSELYWIDEFDFDPVAATTDYSINGSLIAQQGVKLAGRFITLSTKDNGDWISRADMQKLYSALTVETMTLIYHDQSFQVIWRHSDNPIQSEMLMPGYNAALYTVTLKFMIVS